MQGAHEHILAALQRLFTKAGLRTERKHVPHSCGLKKADLWIKDFQLAGVWNGIVAMTLRREFHGSRAPNLHTRGSPHTPTSTAHWMPSSRRFEGKREKGMLILSRPKNKRRRFRISGAQNAVGARVGGHGSGRGVAGRSLRQRQRVTIWSGYFAHTDCTAGHCAPGTELGYI